jgi:4-amino-4-deoxy-L-arabinose transferase-like glycosyltransferase
MINYSKLKYLLNTISALVLIALFIIISVNLSLEKSVWRDEAFSQLLSQQSLVSIITSTASDFNPPLFYLVLHYFQKLLGLEATAQRLLPLVFSVLTIVTVYRTSSYLFTKNNSILLQFLTLLFLITNGSLLYYSYELRPYSMLMWLAYLVFYFSVRFTQNPTKKYAIYLVLSSVALLYTQTLSSLWFGLVSMGFGISLLIEKKWILFRSYLGLIMISIVVYIPWIYVIMSQVQNYSSSFWLQFIPEEKLQNLSALFAYNEGPLHLPKELYERVYLALYRLALLVLFISIIKNKMSRFLAILVTACLIVLWYVSYYAPLFYGRYFVFLSPLVSCLSAFSVYRLINHQTKKTIQKIATFAILGWILGVYGYATVNLWKDYYLGVSRVDYQKVRDQAADSFYATSELDIMSCMVYQPNCYYVGSRILSQVILVFYSFRKSQSWNHG